VLGRPPDDADDVEAPAGTAAASYQMLKTTSRG
jgi:hypothetical protein